MKFVPSGRIGNCGHHGTGLRINIADGRHPGNREPQNSGNFGRPAKSNPPHPRHRKGIGKTPFPEGVGLQQSFRLESEFFIETDGRGIVREDRQLDTPDVQPVVRCVDQGAKQSLADALAGKLVMHADAEIRRVQAPSFKPLQAGDANNLSVDLGNDAQRAAAMALEPFSRVFQTLIGQAQGTGTIERQVRESGYLFEIRDAGGPDG